MWNWMPGGPEFTRQIGAMHPKAPEDPYVLPRNLMVKEQIQVRGILEPKILDAMRHVPRHRFLPEALWNEAYGDHPLPIGPSQTLSQPYIVAAMAEALDLRDSDRVLEVGSGSGYAAAVLSLLVRQVFGLELEASLCQRSRALLQALGYPNIVLRQGDGHLGWPEEAPFQAILLSCATPTIPDALWSQLAEGGRLLLPLGPPGGVQHLALALKQGGQPEVQLLQAVAFVPMLTTVPARK